MRLQSHINEDINLFDILIVLEMIETCHQADSLNESALESVKSLIDKVKAFIKGATNANFWKMVEKDKNIAQHLYKFSGDSARLLYHAFNAYYNKSAESKDYIKELSKDVSNTQFRNILLKLDVMTLSMFTGPIEIIDVITGWKLYDALKKKIKPFDDRAKEAIKTIEILKHDLENPAFKAQAQKYSNALRRVFNIGDYKKVDEETISTDIAEPDIKIGDPERRGDPVKRRLRRQNCKQKDMMKKTKKKKRK